MIIGIILFIVLFFGLNGWVFCSLMREISYFPIIAKVIICVMFWIIALMFIILIFLRNKNIPQLLGHYLYVIGNGYLAFVVYLVMVMLLMLIPKALHIFIPHSFLISIAITSIIYIIGYVHFSHPKIMHQTIAINKNLTKPLPHSHLRVICISDLHLGYGITKNRLKKYVDKINKEQPDIILFAGDLIDMTILPVEKAKMYEELNRLDAPIYMVFGNHDYLSHKNEVMNFLNKTKIHVLFDSTIVLDNGIQLLGRDDMTNSQRKHSSELIEQLDSTKPIFVIDHQPYDKEINEIIKAKADFGIYGHTHHGQFWPVSWITNLIYKQSHGFAAYLQDDKKTKTNVYVSSGLGIWGPQFRIGTNSEIVVVDFSFRN